MILRLKLFQNFKDKIKGNLIRNEKDFDIYHSKHCFAMQF